uniref:Immunoglobulin V-set domain-containing protein n=1 Tax=Anas platyrhynchos TaxID=8839 RepID=A0A8B9TB97_ANAPL
MRQVAVCRAQVQQEPWAETREGTSINITCSHPNIQTGEVIHWYRHLPGQGPAFLMSAFSGSRELTDLPGWLVVAADRRSSALWLTKPRLRDAAVYYFSAGDRPISSQLSIKAGQHCLRNASQRGQIPIQPMSGCFS